MAPGRSGALDGDVPRQTVPDGVRAPGSRFSALAELIRAARDARKGRVGDPRESPAGLYIPNDPRAVTVSRRTLRLILTLHGLIGLVD
ncbi:hypothetical protein ABZ920_10715, partial [Streptomyces sp. NPDC046831]